MGAARVGAVVSDEGRDREASALLVLRIEFRLRREAARMGPLAGMERAVRIPPALDAEPARQFDLDIFGRGRGKAEAGRKDGNEEPKRRRARSAACVFSEQSHRVRLRFSVMSRNQVRGYAVSGTRGRPRPRPVNRIFRAASNRASALVVTTTVFTARREILTSWPLPNAGVV